MKLRDTRWSRLVTQRSKTVNSFDLIDFIVMIVQILYQYCLSPHDDHFYFSISQIFLDNSILT